MKTTAWASMGIVGLLALSACGGGGTASTAGSTPGSSTSPASGNIGKIAIESTDAGRVLADPAGRTLYVFAPDTRGHSTCDGACATYWPPVPGADATHGVAAGVSATLGSTTRSDGTTQLTVDGYPVYTYVGDSAPGQATGQGLNTSGGLWWVISPAGKRIASTPAPQTPGSSASSRGY